MNGYDISGPYPVDMSAYLTLADGTLDKTGIPYHATLAGYHPTTIAQYALAHWNLYLATHDEEHKRAFLAQASWLVEYEVRVGKGAGLALGGGGWPITFTRPEDAIHRANAPLPTSWDAKELKGAPARSSPLRVPSDTYPKGESWLSALAQGCALSVLVRAYQLTHNDTLLEVAHRVIRTFERDILDGGVSAPVGADGIFFEGIAVYPASHRLDDFIFSLFGLYDYLALTNSVVSRGVSLPPPWSSPLPPPWSPASLIERSLATMHILLTEFDLGFWTYSDLLHRQLSTPSQLALQARLLAAVANYAGCNHCLALSARWKGYQNRPVSRLRYQLARNGTACSNAVLRGVRAGLFPKMQMQSPTGATQGPLISPPASSPPTTPPLPLRVCIPVPGFPVTGGTQTVLQGITEVMKYSWHIEYLTQHVGLHSEGELIHRFGTAKTDSWLFPMVWLYCLAGFMKLLFLLRQGGGERMSSGVGGPCRCQGAGYQLLLPQDAYYTSTFAALAARLVGTLSGEQVIRTVCIDHGGLTAFRSQTYHRERVENLNMLPWFRRFMHRILLLGYWPSLALLEWLSAHTLDHFLVPGVVGDGVEEACQRLGIPRSRLTRFDSMVDTRDYDVLDVTSRANFRQAKGIPADAIVITMACRLAPEKGIEIALKALSQALNSEHPVYGRGTPSGCPGSHSQALNSEHPVYGRGTPSGCPGSLTPEQRERVRIIIAGDGLLRQQIEEGIQAHDLGQICELWGELPAQEVRSLLSISDIFLYTSTRGACFAMAVLEAMAAGCAVIASTKPIANATLLAAGRGIAVPANDVVQTSAALIRLVSDPDLCQQMGKLARNYIAERHSPTIFRRTLLRTTYWSGLDEFLDYVTGAMRSL